MDDETQKIYFRTSASWVNDTFCKELASALQWVLNMGLATKIMMAGLYSWAEMREGLDVDSQQPFTFMSGKKILNSSSSRRMMITEWLS